MFNNKEREVIDMSLEQYDWLDRKGVVDAYLYNLVKQDDKFVYLRRSDIGLMIKRKKDIVGWVF